MQGQAPTDDLATLEVSDRCHPRRSLAGLLLQDLALSVLTGGTQTSSARPHSPRRPPQSVRLKGNRNLAREGKEIRRPEEGATGRGKLRPVCLSKPPASSATFSTSRGGWQYELPHRNGDLIAPLRNGDRASEPRKPSEQLRRRNAPEQWTGLTAAGCDWLRRSGRSGSRRSRGRLVGALVGQSRLTVKSPST